jgi:hypothetical protein
MQTSLMSVADSSCDDAQSYRNASCRDPCGGLLADAGRNDACGQVIPARFSRGPVRASSPGQHRNPPSDALSPVLTTGFVPSAARRAEPAPLVENATRSSWPQSTQCTRATPWRGSRSRATARTRAARTVAARRRPDPRERALVRRERAVFGSALVPLSLATVTGHWPLAVALRLFSCDQRTVSAKVGENANRSAAPHGCVRFQ